MRTASISEIKNGLSAYIDLVRAGESIVVTDRGIAVARIAPVSIATDAVGRLERLERAGLIQRSCVPPPRDVLATPPPRPRNDASIVRALLEERQESR